MNRSDRHPSRPDNVHEHPRAAAAGASPAPLISAVDRRVGRLRPPPSRPLPAPERGARGGTGWMAVVFLLLTSCVGRIGDVLPSEDGPESNPGQIHAQVSGMRRLSRIEYANTVRDLIALDVPMDVSHFPIDPLAPYDNDYRQQLPSPVVVEASQSNARMIAAWVHSNTAVREQIVDCGPTGPDDADCMRHFVETFGRRALRRPLGQEEVERYLDLMSWNVAEGDFYTGVELALEALLTQPQFLFRVEIGTPAEDGVLELDDFEIATRLSYLLLGTTPDDELLDRAALGELRDEATRRAEAERLLALPQAKVQLARFHAMWLGYEKLANEAGIVAEMRVESDGLVQRVTTEKQGAYTELLTSTETFVSQPLADHYGFGVDVGDGAWVPYSDPGRRGILSHGTVLAAGSKANDTSPTRRGKFVRVQLLCEPIAPPPPEVDPDQPPASKDPDACKIERYAEHRENETCAGCHKLMDGIGFGLENYDLLGRYRTHDEGRPECVIEGKGDVVGVGKFEGPAQLGELVLDSGSFEGCVAQQALQYSLGHTLEKEDRGMVRHMAEVLRDRNDFIAMLLAHVEHPAFAQRREEAVP